MTPILLLLVIFVLLLIYLNTFRLPKNFPPGPKNFPIWGGYYQVLWENMNLPYKTFHSMAKRYKTNVVGLFLGNFKVVVACDLETCRDVMLKPEFQGRVDAFLPRYRGDGDLLGVIFSEGPLWQEQRRFMLRNMRDFGFGKRSDSLEHDLQEEVQDLIDLIRKGNTDICKGRVAKIPELLYAINANMAIQIYSGDRKPLPEAYEFGHIMAEQAKVIDATTGALNITPWMRHLFPSLIGYNVTKKATKYAKQFVDSLISNHKENMSDETSNDFIDRYIQEMKNRIYRGDEYTSFTERQLQVIGLDMLFAASTTIPFMTSFILLLLTKYKEVQRKCQEEIDNVVGQNRLPTLQDRQFLPYCEATIREAMRYQTLAPLGVPHKALEDTTLGGYFIPKGTMVLTSIYSAHRDEKVWDEPDKFMPERFIDNDGKIIRKDMTVPFGLGKRVCAGETFARQNIFVQMTGLLQSFDFEVPDQCTLPDLSENVSGISESPKPFLLKFIDRVYKKKI